MGWVVKATPRPLYPQERESVAIVQAAVWTQGRIWTSEENLATYRDSIPGQSSP